MKLHWTCNNPKCFASNESQIDDAFINGDGSVLFDLGPCTMCGNPHRFFTLWNQRVSVEEIGVKKS